MPWDRALLERRSFFTLKSWTCSYKNFSPVTLARQLGIPGGCEPRVLMRCSGDALARGCPAHPSSLRRLVRRSPRAVAAVAASWLGCGAGLIEGRDTERCPEPPWHLRQMPAGKGAERE